MWGRRWGIGVAVAGLVGLTAWLIAGERPVATWLVLAGWGVVVIAIAVRALRPGARGHRLRSGFGPALDGLNEVQGLYLGRPETGPASFGSVGPPTTALALDRTEPDPGDLRRVPRGA